MFSFAYFSKMISLLEIFAERQKKRLKDRKRNQSFICWFTTQMALIARAVPGQNEEPEFFPGLRCCGPYGFCWNSGCPCCRQDLNKAPKKANTCYFPTSQDVSIPYKCGGGCTAHESTFTDK